jgi:cell division protein FtsI/penicillin-binding protein 2
MTNLDISQSRISLLRWSLYIVISILVFRLFILQVIDHNKYMVLADQEQVKSLTIPASRGEIYALDQGNAVKIVLNQTVFTVFVDPKEVSDPEKVISSLRDIAGGNLVKNVDALVKAKPSRYKVVARNVTSKQAELLRAKHLAGVGFQKMSQRVYPEKTMAAQTLGFVNAEGKGQYGVEEFLDADLRGQDGMLKAVTDISNVPLTIGKDNIDIPAKNGKNVVLSIDRNVQAYTETALVKGLEKSGAKYGSAIVINPQNGQIMAMANMPTYDPGEYSKVTDIAAFNNGTVSVPYEPGSDMKSFTIATGLDKGVIEPTSSYVNTDRIQVGDRTIENASKGQTGSITMQHALNWSLNTGMVTIAERLGDGNNITPTARQTMYDYLHNKFGLGQLTGIQVAGEAKGQVYAPDTAEGNAVQYATMSFGQGMNLTMVQVASGFCSIINGGRYFTPTLIAGYVDSDGSYMPNATPLPARQTISANASQKAKQMIHDARAAFYAKNDKKGYDIGGKTGTSQTLINGSYENSQTVGSYLGYGGNSSPQYVIMVQVSSPGRNLAGNTDAMPIFTDISNWMIDYLKLQPQEQ